MGGWGGKPIVTVPWWVGGGKPIVTVPWWVGGQAHSHCTLVGGGGGKPIVTVPWWVRGGGGKPIVTVPWLMAQSRFILSADGLEVPEANLESVSRVSSIYSSTSFPMNREQVFNTLGADRLRTGIKVERDERELRFER